MRGLALLAVLLVLASPAAGPPAHAPPIIEKSGPFTLTIVYPTPGTTVHNTTPTIEATFTDSVSTIPYEGVNISVDHRDVTGFEGVNITPKSVSYAVESLFPLKAGPANVTIVLTDRANNTATFGWNFSVNTTPLAKPSHPIISVQQLLFDMAVGAAIAAAAFGGWILYLKRTTRFQFRKYFITHPVQRSYLILYVPAIAALFFFMVGLDWVATTPGLPPMASDYVIVGVIFIALTAFAIDARRQLMRTRTYERAFAQFLFEMADAMRGGIDPAKALVEFSKTSSNILKRHLRIAADGIKIGRSFETVLRDMVRSMGSPLIQRYADLIADASGVGGETALVVYRAAKDMDDFVKIEEERVQQLTLPVAIIYISFAVLLAVLFALLYIAPTLGTLNINFLGGGGNPLASTGSSTATVVPRLDVGTLHERFYELMLINALGTGAIIGAFTEGKARYGLLHALGLVAATTIAFALFNP